MAEQSSWPTQNSGPTGTIDSREAAQHIGALLVPQTSILKTKSGFRPGPGSSPGVVTATGTPDGFVHVAPFELMLQNIRGSGLGTYLACLDAIKDINILSTPADPTNPRDDLVIAQQSDIFDSDANSNFDVKQVVGTPAVSPTDPTVTGSSNHVTLARVRVDANATTITSGKITDLRTSGHAKSLTGGLHTVALGGILPVASSAQRDALTGLYSGLMVWRTDIKVVECYDGAAWRPITPYRDFNILGSAAADVTFSSIPAGFRALELHIRARGDTAATNTGVRVQFNGDTGTTYDGQQMVGHATTIAAFEATGVDGASIGETAAANATSGASSSHTVMIPWYADTTFWKTFTVSHNLATTTGSDSGQSKHWASRWRSTAAITSIKILPTAGNFATGSSFALYGLP